MNIKKKCKPFSGGSQVTSISKKQLQIGGGRGFKEVFLSKQGGQMIYAFLNNPLVSILQKRNLFCRPMLVFAFFSQFSSKICFLNEILSARFLCHSATMQSCHCYSAFGANAIARLSCINMLLFLENSAKFLC